MRPWLRWGLVGSVILSAAALIRPHDEALLNPSEVAVVSASSQSPSQPSAPNSPASLDKLPKQLHSAGAWPVAQFDPFVGAMTPLPQQVSKVQPVVVSDAPPPPPQPPAMNYRYLGQFVDPEGKPAIYVVKDDNAVQVLVGTKLDGGYIVQSITADGIKLHHPGFDAYVVIYIPPPPEAANS